MISARGVLRGISASPWPEGPLRTAPPGPDRSLAAGTDRCGALRFYEPLTDTLICNPQNVWILAADGTNSADDKNTGTYSDPHDENSDFLSITGNGTSGQLHPRAGRR